MQIHTTWTNNNPDTIWNRLAKRLGREPTNDEAADEVRRILRASAIGDTSKPLTAPARVA